jgi:hypothetical protein
MPIGAICNSYCFPAVSYCGTFQGVIWNVKAESVLTDFYRIALHSSLTQS